MNLRYYADSSYIELDNLVEIEEKINDIKLLLQDVPYKESDVYFYEHEIALNEDEFEEYKDAEKLVENAPKYFSSFVEVKEMLE